MTTYTFYVNGDYKTVESDTEEEGIEAAGIKEGDVQNLVEIDTFDEKKCLLSAITEDLCMANSPENDCNLLIYMVIYLILKNKRRYV